MEEYINEKLNKFNKEMENKKIAIIGLGTSNIPLIEYFYNTKSIVSVFDNRELDQLDESTV